MRRDGEKARGYALRHGVAYSYAQAEAVIQNAEVDAVYIATPAGSHLAYDLQICAAGKPAYVEKPMARSASECRTMIDAFDRAGLPFFIAFYRRALPRFLKAKKLIETGRLGKITSVSYRFCSPAHRNVEAANLPWRVKAEEAGGGLFLDLGCHTLDILDFMLGPLQDVHGSAANLATPHDVEDNVVMAFRCHEGASGTAAWNFAGYVQEDIIDVTGTEGRIVLSTFGNEPVHLLTNTGNETFDLPNPAHIQQPLIQTIIDQLQGEGQCPSSGQSALRTAQVMDTVLSDYYAGREDSFWTRPQTWNRQTHQ